MCLHHSRIENLARIRADLRIGGAIVVVDGATALVACAAETVPEGRFAALHDLGPVELSLTARRAMTLKARVYDQDIARMAVPRDAGLDLIRAFADPQMDLDHPMKGPLAPLRDRTATAHRTAIRLAKQAHLLPAVIGVTLERQAAEALAAKNALSIVAPGDLPADGASLLPVSRAFVPLEVANSRVHVFRPNDGSEEHYAVEIGDPPRDAPVLSRLHSACFTGDVIGSLKCDCGPQLNAALSRMAEEGSGVLLYLNQEGRGIGLANKMRAYHLQDQGFDTVEANHRLGFEDDERDFRTGAEILKRLGFSAVRLLTNNPAKVGRMSENGVAVAERVALRVGENPLNQAYLRTKADKSGHLL